MTNLETKIKEWLEDEIQSSREVIAEYTDNHRPKCDDGSDDFIEGKLDLAEKLLSIINENSNCPTWEELAETGMSPKMIQATIDEWHNNCSP